MLRKGGKLLKLLPDPVFRSGLTHGVAAAVEHAPLFYGLDLKTIVDVGANKGQFSLYARSRSPHAKIIAFEPIPGPADRFATVLPDIQLHRVAVSDADGKIDINLHQLDVGASFLPLGGDHVGTLSVETRRLDSVLHASDIQADALLKIDVQGCEDRVIAGASGILHRFRYLICEVAFFPMLEGMITTRELIPLLAERGFHVAGANEVKTLNGRAAWCDLLFSRA
jgi:FkbM family methyltransferase